MNVLKDLVDGRNLADIFDEGLDHINEDESIKGLLAKKIGEDIQQYLPDIGAIWGDEAVVVKVKDDKAYAVWNDHWMPTIDFYQLVYKNGGVVEPKDFENYENLL